MIQCLLAGSAEADALTDDAVVWLDDVSESRQREGIIGIRYNEESLQQEHSAFPFSGDDFVSKEKW